MNRPFLQKSYTGYLEQTEHRLKSSQKAIYGKGKSAPKSEAAASKILIKFAAGQKNLRA